MEKDINNNLYLNGELCHLEREYIPNLYERFINLARVSVYIDGFLVLYSQPNSINIAKIFPNTPIFDLGVGLELAIDDNDEVDKKYDFCFIGSPTKYRKYIIQLIAKKYKIFSGYGLNEEERKKIIKNSKYNLNIPQTAEWRYISPMRINYAAKNGSFTVNVMEAAIHYPNTIPIPINEIIQNDIKYIDEMVSCAKKNQLNNNVIYDNNLKALIEWLN